MEKVRQPAVAGLFYPADTGTLQATVQQYLETALAKASGPAPKAVIAPHAGYIYSGPIAASAYARLWPARDTLKRIILIGPSHYVAFDGLALSSASAFATPLGTVPIDTQAQAQVQHLPQVIVLDSVHAREHSLEVHLPFLQTLLGEFSVVPIAVGDAAAEEVASVLEKLWDGEETAIVVSSDLSHYYDYETAVRLDQATSRAIEALQVQDIHYEQACGRIPITGLLVAARRRGLHASTVDLRNSGDTAGPKDRVVGYGAYVFA
jgi:hypothetical protein